MRNLTDLFGLIAYMTLMQGRLPEPRLLSAAFVKNADDASPVPSAKRPARARAA